jgi:solute:Na+ symporter, SSS family
VIDVAVSVAVLVGALGVFAVIGLRGVRGAAGEGLDDYVVARGSQRAPALGLSFLASGLGAWILFAPPELGALLGLGAVVGYAVAAAGPFLVLAVVGPRLRAIVPEGQGLGEFVRARFGRAAGTAVALVSVAYMGVFLAAELVAVAGIAELLGGVPRTVTVVAVVAATLAYTTSGGLRASLRTDRWQSWLVVVLLVVAAGAVLRGVAEPVAEVRRSGLLGIDRASTTTAATLIIAVTAANLFHHGYWQRVWSATDDRALRRGALLGAAITVPVMLLAGGFGIVAASVGAAEVPALSLFALVAELPTAVVAAVLLLGIALVASSVDTLENGLAALVVAERPALQLPHARLTTVLVVLPAAVVGVVADSVLQLFLIADLLCAALVAPALLGLWRRTTTAGVVAGAAGGLAGALAGGWLEARTLAGTLDAVLFVDAVPTLLPFAGAVLAGAVTTVLVSLTLGRTTELDAVAAEVHAARIAAGAGAGVAGEERP